MSESKHQALMDAAYRRWQNGGDLNGNSYEDFVKNLDEIHRSAVVLGNLNYQVNNGGFIQWCDDGYVDCADELVDALPEIGTRAARRVAAMVEDVWDKWDEAEALDPYDFEDECHCYDDCDDESEVYCDCDDGQSAYESERSSLLDFDSYDREFYDGLGDMLLAQVEVYLRRLCGETVEDAPDLPEPELAPEKTGEASKRRKPVVKLIGQDGNAFSIMGAVSAALKRAGYSPAEVAQYRRESMSGNYDNVLSTAMKWAEVR